MPALAAPNSERDQSAMAGLSNKLCVARHILHTILTDVLLLGTELTTPAGWCSVSVWHSLRLADHGLRADLLHEISWRVSSPTDPRADVVVFNCSTLGSSVALAFLPLSVARARHEVTRVQEIQPPAPSGGLLIIPCPAAHDCNHRGVCSSPRLGQLVIT